MKTPEDIEETCKKLKPIIGDKADNLWYFYLAEDERGRKEIALDIEIIAEKLLKKDALSKKEILLPPPSEEDSSGSILLGDVVYHNKKLHQLFLKPEDFKKQIGIFAITGEGKTNLAYLMALQLLKSKTPFMAIDWKRSWRNILSLKDKHPELKDVQVFTIGRDILPFPWNPFRAPPGADKQLWVSTIAEALERSHISGQGVAEYLNRIYAKKFKDFDGDFYPNFYDGKRELEGIRAYQRELQWKQSALRIFNSFTIGPVAKVFNTRNPIKLEELLDKPVIFELDLEMPKPLRIFFSEIILRWIHLYRLHQGETEKLRHVLFLEEVHNLFPTSRFERESSNSLENVYREIRAFGEGIVSITQHPSLLPIYLLGNCHTQIYLGLQHEDDVRTARKSLFLKYEEESYPSMLNVGECIVKIKNRIDPCLVKIPLVPIKIGVINDAWLKAQNLPSMFWKYAWKGDANHPKCLSLKNKIGDILSGKKGVDKGQPEVNTPSKTMVNTKGYFQKQFGVNTPVSDANNDNKVAKTVPKSSANIEVKKNKYPLNVSPNKLLEDIFLNPFSSATHRYKRLRLNPKYGNKYKNQLTSEGCIIPKKIITGKGWITLFDLTQKGKAVLRDLGHDMINRSEGIVHKYWKHQIAEYYKSKNLEVKIEEYYVNGRPDIIVINKDKKAAIEIETGKSDIFGNIKRALEAGFDEVISVATNRLLEGKIRGELEKRKIIDERVRVSCVLGFNIK